MFARCLNDDFSHVFWSSLTGACITVLHVSVDPKAKRMNKSRADVLLAGVLNIAFVTLVLYEFWQFYSLGSVDLFGKMSGWHKVTYSEHPDRVMIVLAIYVGMLAYCTILLARAILSKRARNT
jgi:hypothetical protein